MEDGERKRRVVLENNRVKMKREDREENGNKLKGKKKTNKREKKTKKKIMITNGDRRKQ